LIVALAIAFTWLDVGSGSEHAARQPPRSLLAANEPPPAAAAKPETGDWKPYTSAEGRYSAMLPGTPKVSESVVDSPMGKVVMHMAAVVSRTGAYFISYGDVPGTGPVNTEGALNGARDSIVRTVGPLLKETAVKLGPHPGRELLFDAPKMKAKVRVRVFVVKRRTYQLMAMAPGDADPQGAATLFASFKLHK
jgi:hypothetical protein